MDYDQRYEFVIALIDASAASLSAKQIDDVKVLAFEGSEFDLAIKRLLDWSIIGKWALPESLFPLVRQWAADMDTESHYADQFRVVAARAIDAASGRVLGTHGDNE